MPADDQATSGGTPHGAARTLHSILETMKDKPQTADQTSDHARTQRGAETADSAKLGNLIDRLDERAFGLMLLLLALPCCLPFIYLLPQIVALPMLALAGQLAAGRQHPWLPKALHEREFSIPAFQSVISKSERYLGWVERFARPRLLSLSSDIGVRIVGLLLLVPTASILVPLPSTNTVPGIGVAIASLGLIERDGLLIILGLLIGFFWVALLLFLGVEAVEIIKNWLAARP